MEDHRDHDHDHDHDHNHRSGGGSGGGPPASPRWNPTKEQINMLESLYGQGIRTPSAEQIQQITTRLRAFGHIEGKNVFYWFQNHKARQRQKQKQESLAYINRFLHRSNPNTHPTFPPTTSHHIPCANVVCGPYYVPVQSHGDPIGTFHQQCQQTTKLPLSNATRSSSTVSRTSPRLQKLSQATRIVSGASVAAYDRVLREEHAVDFVRSSGNHRTKMAGGKSRADQETLPLFPLSPTGDLQRKCDREENPPDDRDRGNSEDISTSVTDNREVEEGCSSSGGCDKLFYDFFPR